MRKLKVILLEAPLELAPESWHHGPLIDKRYHYHKLSKFPQKWKRGRPDILHTTLLILQDSILNQEGFLELYFHVISGEVYKVRADERIPKHYDAFKEIMAQLLKYGKVPPDSEEPLIWKAYDDLSQFVKEQGKFILMHEKGTLKKPSEVVTEALREGRAIGIGVFPRGDFKRSTLRKAYKAYSIWRSNLKAWTVACKLTSSAEELIIQFS